MIWIAVGIVTAVSAAVGSTWSPCGLSVLSIFTPVGERARGRRYWVTVLWFVAGAVLGGAVLGALAAGGAALMSAQTWIGAGWAEAIAAVLFAAGAGLDLELGGDHRLALPHHRRQVNEQWLDRFRRWVSAGGFGAQIGFGLATYIMTTGVYLTVAIGVLSADPKLAFSLGVLFGGCRGLAILVGSFGTTPARLGRIHERIELLRRPVRALVGVVLIASGWALAAEAVGRPGRVVLGDAATVLAAAAAVATVLAVARRLGLEDLLGERRVERDEGRGVQVGHATSGDVTA